MSHSLSRSDTELVSFQTILDIWSSRTWRPDDFRIYLEQPYVAPFESAGFKGASWEGSKHNRIPPRHELEIFFLISKKKKKWRLACGSSSFPVTVTRLSHTLWINSTALVPAQWASAVQSIWPMYFCIYLICAWSHEPSRSWTPNARCTYVDNFFYCLNHEL